MTFSIFPSNRLDVLLHSVHVLVLCRGAIVGYALPDPYLLHPCLSRLVRLLKNFDLGEELLVPCSEGGDLVFGGLGGVSYAISRYFWTLDGLKRRLTGCLLDADEESLQSYRSLRNPS